MNGEEDKLTAFVIHPGWCQTDMGNSAAVIFRLEQAPVEVMEACSGILQLIDRAGKESHGGKFWNYDGEQLAW